MNRNLEGFYMQTKTPAGNEGFGVRRGAVSWDTSQEFGSSPPARAFVKPRPTPSPRHVVGNFTAFVTGDKTQVILEFL